MCYLKFDQEIITSDESKSNTPLPLSDSIERFRKCYRDPCFSRPVVPSDTKFSAREPPPAFSRPTSRGRGGLTNGKDAFYPDNNIPVAKPLGK